jgi:FKBP-type peptidyl-prolyl cis-trans isomerase 2
VTNVADESITVDANHPLAKKALRFDIELIEIV